eukprot:CAMPEP_0194763778 /NCGR_PEP_ID=MMETSP0323_2-20130528/20516_1 /TAXON_ID=2866 ORGANISM="Crypthecodinium cohnii, Strain Seligo" /NCGR_SAMPLE_ID=MMETSP0323_2 /ASSEMBLY_ACC=CAM_ASM_000346 /LENGTH=160 /DNA_ID=CAMNT_0039689455 /DNA_START=23 /DNA_END=505 /DNA_ORIENTATION=+
MALLRPLRQLARPMAARGICSSPVRSQMPLVASAAMRPAAAVPVSDFDLASASALSGKSGALLASSPLFLTDLKVPTYWTEIQFVLAGPINTLMESFFEVEGGPLFLNAMVMATLLKMATYYGFMQPSYLWHFQERYGQQWTVGHHLYGCSEPNPLKKGQ